jgi:hypothetical protein
MALTLEKDLTQPAGRLTSGRLPAREGERVVSMKLERRAPAQKGRLTAAELDDIAAEFDEFLEESGGVLAY